MATAQHSAGDSPASPSRRAGSLMVALARLGREEGVVGKALVRGRRHPGGVLVAARHAVAVH